MVNGTRERRGLKRSRRPNIRLTRARLARGWTQNQVARQMQGTAASQGLPDSGIDANYVSRWERGMMPQAYHAYLLCLVFAVSADDLGLKPRALDRISGEASFGETNESWH